MADIQLEWRNLLDSSIAIGGIMATADISALSLIHTSVRFLVGKNGGPVTLNSSCGKCFLDRGNVNKARPPCIRSQAASDRE